MQTVIDVGTEGGTEVLQRSTTDGLIRSKTLLDKPLETYLRQAEKPRYVAWNKREGVTRIDGGSETIKPTGNYRAFLVATDSRVLFVVGDSTGDRRLSIAHDDIVAVECSAEFSTSTLELVTVEERRWQFTCRGNLTPIQEFVDEATQIWTRAKTHLDRAERQLETAREALIHGDLTDAASATESTEESLRSGQERVQEFCEDTDTTLEDQIDPLRRRIASCHRDRYLQAGVRRHRTARAAWEERDYEEAANAFERARAEYERALDVDADSPPRAEIESNLATVDEEYRQLLSAPIEAAEAAAGAASSATDPETRAERLESAISRYRDALELDWGRDRRFDGDPESLRGAAADTAAELVDAHVAAGEQYLETSDWQARVHDTAKSKAALKNAREHFERAEEVAVELAPTKQEAAKNGLATVAERMVSIE